MDVSLREAGLGFGAEHPERAGWRAPELAVVVPTFNERANVAVLVDRLDACLAGLAWEVVFVDDDSPDGTAEAVRELARRDPRVRCLRRVGRRGLASACVEGMLATSAPLLAVMDADLQHDEALLPAMVERLREGDVDLVVGTRYAAGTAVPGWDEGRRRMSRLATRLGRAALGVPLSDPMSGFFAVRREALERVVRGLSAVGFKILLDILATRPAAAAGGRAALPLPAAPGRREQARQPGRRSTSCCSSPTSWSAAGSRCASCSSPPSARWACSSTSPCWRCSTGSGPPASRPGRPRRRWWR